MGRGGATPDHEPGVVELAQVEPVRHAYMAPERIDSVNQDLDLLIRATAVQHGLPTANKTPEEVRHMLEGFFASPRSSPKSRGACNAAVDTSCSFRLPSSEGDGVGASGIRGWEPAAHSDDEEEDEEETAGLLKHGRSSGLVVAPWSCVSALRRGSMHAFRSSRFGAVVSDSVLFLAALYTMIVLNFLVCATAAGWRLAPSCGLHCNETTRSHELVWWQRPNAIAWYCLLGFCSPLAFVAFGWVRWVHRCGRPLWERVCRTVALVPLAFIVLNHGVWEPFYSGLLLDTYIDWDPDVARADAHRPPPTLTLPNGTAVSAGAGSIVVVGNGPLSPEQRAFIRATNPQNLFRFNGMANLLPDEPVRHPGSHRDAHSPRPSHPFLTVARSRALFSRWRVRTLCVGGRSATCLRAAPPTRPRGLRSRTRTCTSSQG
jgi:hypothetical protein